MFDSTYISTYKKTPRICVRKRRRIKYSFYKKMILHESKLKKRKRKRKGERII